MQNAKINRKCIQYIVKKKKTLSISSLAPVSFYGKSKKEKGKTAENILIFSQWLFQSGEITTEVFPLSICFSVILNWIK